MQCEDAVETIRTAGSQRGIHLRAARDHVASCGDCRSALRALDAMPAVRELLVPIVSEDAIERAIHKTLTTSPVLGYRRGFWTGLASGTALAATLAATAVGVWLWLTAGDALVGVPEVRIALNQPSDVTVTLESPERLSNAEVRVELRGAIALVGYPGQRELRWSTDLDRGINELTLPVVASDAGGGQVLVEVRHGDKRRAFVLDVRAEAVG
jgi:hypothetical protein